MSNRQAVPDMSTIKGLITWGVSVLARAVQDCQSVCFSSANQTKQHVCFKYDYFKYLMCASADVLEVHGHENKVSKQKSNIETSTASQDGGQHG